MPPKKPGAGLASAKKRPHEAPTKGRRAFAGTRQKVPRAGGAAADRFAAAKSAGGSVRGDGRDGDDADGDDMMDGALDVDDDGARGRKDEDDSASEERKMPFGFNVALAAAVATSVFAVDAISPEWAEAARSSGRMGGSSFRSAPRAAPRASVGSQSRQAPPPQVMRGGMGYGYGMPMFMPFSPFGFGMGFGFGGLGFLFNILAFLWIANFFVNLLSSVTQSAGRNDDDDMGPPRNY